MAHLHILLKLRIGFVIMLTALAGLVITPGPSLAIWQILLLAAAVLCASSASGGFNHYHEIDIDARMRRTRHRPFVTGIMKHQPVWLWLLGALLAIPVTAVAIWINPMAALYVFLGAFFYGVVYTVWLKRRTWINILIGGLAGSFAVLAGAAAVSPTLGSLPLLFAAILFFWTPPHFWSLAIALRQDYEDANIPMLPVVVGNALTARVVLGHTVALTVVSLAPLWWGMGVLYALGAVTGCGYFLWKSVALVRDPTAVPAMSNFRASLVQLGLLLTAAVADRILMT
jgi:protoheme IX farnesyltransferase